MMDRLDMLLTHTGKVAAKIFAKDSFLAPVWIVETADGQCAVITTPWGDDDEKQGMLETLRERFAACGVVRYDGSVGSHGRIGQQRAAPRPAEPASGTHRDRGVPRRR
jgi:hypothetical protein